MYVQVISTQGTLTYMQGTNSFGFMPSGGNNNNTYRKFWVTDINGFQVQNIQLNTSLNTPYYLYSPLSSGYLRYNPTTGTFTSVNTSTNMSATAFVQTSPTNWLLETPGDSCNTSVISATFVTVNDNECVCKGSADDDGTRPICNCGSGQFCDPLATTENKCKTCISCSDGNGSCASTLCPGGDCVDVGGKGGCDTESSICNCGAEQTCVERNGEFVCVNNSELEEKNNTALIVGIIIGLILFFILIGVLFFFLMKPKTPPSTSTTTLPPSTSTTTIIS